MSTERRVWEMASLPTRGNRKKRTVAIDEQDWSALEDECKELTQGWPRLQPADLIRCMVRDRVDARAEAAKAKAAKAAAKATAEAEREAAKAKPTKAKPAKAKPAKKGGSRATSKTNR